MPLTDLLENIVRVTGKDSGRIREVLLQGTVVAGASRIRWTPLEAALDEITRSLRIFPDPQPDRPFDASRCVRAALSGGRAVIDLARETASRKRWFHKRSFWQALMGAAERLALEYHHYSYADRADVYRAELPLETARALRGQAGLLRYASLETQVREYSYNALELWVER